MLALPGLCAAYSMLPSRCFPIGHLAVERQSTVRVGGAEVRRGTLDGLMVVVTQSVTYNPTGSSEGSSQEVTLSV